MSWELLPTNFTDAIWSGLKKYNQIDNPDGTVSFQDVTVYSNKEKSFFGAQEANRIDEALNTLMSMVENGTDLYEVFQTYFETQKELFTGRANTEFSDFQTYSQTLKGEIDTIVQAIRTSTDTEYANFAAYVEEKEGIIAGIVTAIRTSTDDEFAQFQAYIAALEQQGDDAIAGIKTDYRDEMDAFEENQERLFNVWFEAIRNRLSGDIATSLQDQIDVLKDQVAGFTQKQTIFSEDGKTITENTPDGEVRVRFNDDGSIVEQQYQGGVLVKTKTTTFSADGLTISEEVS